MRNFTLLMISSIAILSGSCKKCYECTCIKPSDGCGSSAQFVELCDRGLIGKAVLTSKVLDLEFDGYVCTVK